VVKHKWEGQKTGEMEVWGLEAHQAAYILQEMLTINPMIFPVGHVRSRQLLKGTDIPEATVRRVSACSYAS